MGSFSSTCAVSGFPIQYGDSVRFFLVTEAPSEGRQCYMHSLWVPRTPPLKGKYNDYGTVEDYEEGPAQDLWLKGFQWDLIETGWGENPCHDSPAKKDMTFAQLLEAIWEERVFVKPVAGVYAGKGIDPQPSEDRTPEGVPTLRRMEAALEGLPLYDGNYSVGGYMIEIDGAKAIIRWHRDHEEDFQEEKQVCEKRLGEARARLEKYKTTLKDRGQELDLIVESWEEYRTNPPYPGCKPKLQVRIAMIREDVWQALLRDPIEVMLPVQPFQKVTVEDYYSGLMQWDLEQREKLLKVMELDEIAKNLNTEEAKMKAMKAIEVRLQLFELQQEFPSSCLGAWVIAGRLAPGVISLGDHARLMRRGVEPLPQDFLKTLAEFSFIYSVLQDLRYYWRPTYTIGPQCGGWGEQKSYLTRMLEIATEQLKQEEDDMC